MNECNYLDLFHEHAGWWLRGHCQSSEGLLSPQRHALCEPSLALLIVGELVRGLRPGRCWVCPDLGVCGCGFCHHLPGCSWTSQSWWLWRNDSTQRLWTSTKPGTANGKPETATAVVAALKACTCFCLRGTESSVIALGGERDLCVFWVPLSGSLTFNFLEKLAKEKCCLLIVNYRVHDTLKKS